METKTHTKIFAIALDEFVKWGCPYCGFRSGTCNLSVRGSALWQCGECEKGCIVLAIGVVKSSLGIGEGDNTIYPEITDHPRKGIPAHGKPDIRPERGGEFFYSRGIGTDVTPGCFVCGGKTGHYHNIAAFVECKEAGERVVSFFPTGARLDWRELEPDRVQVKIGACNKHMMNLRVLQIAVTESQGVITEEMVKIARQ